MINDQSRSRRTYSFHRQQPVPFVQNVVTVVSETIVLQVSETIVRVGSMNMVDVFASRPASGTTGDTFYATDACSAFFFSGSAGWRPFFGPGMLGTAPGSTGSFAPFFGTSPASGSMVDDKGSWLLTVPASAIAQHSASSTAVFSLPPLTGSLLTTVAVQHDTVPVVADVLQGIGIGFLSSSGQTGIILSLITDSTGAQEVSVFSDGVLARKINHPPGFSRHAWLRVSASIGPMSLSASVHMSADNGSTWTTLAAGSSSVASASIAFHPIIIANVNCSSSGPEPNDVLFRVLSYATSSSPT